MISGKMRGAAGITIPSGDAYYSVAGSTNTFTVPANVTSLYIAMTTGTTTTSVVGKASVVRNSNNNRLAITSKYISPTYTSSTSGLVLPIAAGNVLVFGKGGDASTSSPTFQMNLTANYYTYSDVSSGPFNVPPNNVYLGGSSIPPSSITVYNNHGLGASIPGDGNGNYNGVAYNYQDVLNATMSFRYTITSSGGSTIPGTSTSITISGSGGTATFAGASSGTSDVQDPIVSFQLLHKHQPKKPYRSPLAACLDGCITPMTRNVAIRSARVIIAFNTVQTFLAP